MNSYTTKIGLGLLCIGLCLPNFLAAQVGTITDGGVTFEFNGAEGSADFFVPNGTEHLFQTWWWYRVSGDTEETPLPAPDLETYIANVATLTWADVDGRGFSAELVITLLDTGGGASATVDQVLTIATAGAPVTIDLFSYADFDVSASTQNTATLVNANNHMEIVGSGDTAQYAFVQATALQVLPFAQIRTLLNDAAVTNLDNSGLPFAIADFTGGFQVNTTVDNTLAPQSFTVKMSINDPIVLPVELVSFEASVDDDTALLTWSTASETNNAGFEVQQEVAEEVYETLAYVEGKGTTLESQSYSYRVEDLAYGANRFRLKQVDFDGAFEYSETVEVLRNLPDGYVLSAFYPNPFNPQGQFTLLVAGDQHVEIGVYDLMGQLVQTLHSGEMAGQAQQRFTFEARSGLPSGTYLILVTGETFTAQQKVLLLK